MRRPPQRGREAQGRFSDRRCVGQWKRPRLAQRAGIARRFLECRRDFGAAGDSHSQYHITSTERACLSGEFLSSSPPSLLPQSRFALTFSDVPRPHPRPEGHRWPDPPRRANPNRPPTPMREPAVPFQKSWRDYHSGDLLYGLAMPRGEFAAFLGVDDLCVIDQYEISSVDRGNATLVHDPDFIAALSAHAKYGSVVTDADGGWDLANTAQWKFDTVGMAALAKRKCKGGLNWITH